MGQVTVTIDNKSYRMVCDDGQEAHLESLAAYFDGRVQEMRSSFGEIGDMRLTIMAAITTADEIMELRRRLAALETDLSAERQALSEVDRRQAERDNKTAEAIAALADRVERIAKGLAAV